MRRLLIQSCMMLALSFSGVAQSGHTPVTYSQVYVATDIPNSRINAMVQDPRGFVWIGTRNGLFRYDGVRYKVFKNAPGTDKKISFNRIASLYMLHDRYLVIEGVRDLNILDILSEELLVETPAGKVFIQSFKNESQCIFQFEDLQFETHLYTWSPGKDLQPVHQQARIRINNGCLDSQGNLFFFDKKGYFWTGDPAYKHVTCLDSSTFAGRRLLYLPQLVCGPDSQIWAIDNATDEFNNVYSWHTRDGFVKKWPVTHRITLLPGPTPDQLWHLNLDNYLISRVILQTGQVTPVLFLPAEIQNITAMMEDLQGNLWIGSTLGVENGILMAQPHVPAFKKFLYQPDRQLDLGIACRSIIEWPRGQILVGGFTGLYTFDTLTEQANHVPLPNISDDIKTINIWKMIGDTTAGRVWFTKEEGGIYELKWPEGNLRSYQKGNTVSNRMLALAMDTTGLLWLGSHSGLTWFDSHNRTFDHLEETSKMFYGVSSYSWVPAGRGNYWLCSSNGLFLLAPDRTILRQYSTTSSPHLHTNEVYDITGDGHTWWIATDNGLHRLRGDSITRYTTDQGMADNNIASVALDDQGNVWAATFHGLSRLNPGSGSVQNYYVEDGLPHNEFNRQGVFKRRDGRLFFGTQNGVVHFQPEELSKQVPAHSLILTDFLTFDSEGTLNQLSPADIAQLSRIQIPAGNKYFQLEFALLNYRQASDNRYTYYMAGLESDWRPLQTQPFIQYNNLPPGNYTLHIKAISPSGQWAKNTLEIPVYVQQHFHQTTTFRLLGIITAFGLAFAFLRYRYKQGLHIERLRNRLSADLHDEVGGVLSGIAMQMDLLENKAPHELRPFMQRIAASSRGAAIKMRDVIWSLDSSKDHFQDLMDRMKAFTLELLSPLDIQYTIGFDGIDPHDKPGLYIRQNLYLIFKEALTNVIKHSRASEVSIRLKRDRHGLTLSVADNGQGLPDKMRPGGHGMINMQRRAERIGGRLEILTPPDGGTEIRLSLSHRGILSPRQSHSGK